MDVFVLCCRDTELASPSQSRFEHSHASSVDNNTPVALQAPSPDYLVHGLPS